MTVQFEQNYSCAPGFTAVGGNLAILDKIEPHATGIKAMFARFGGATFNKGVYRLFSIDALRKWTSLAEEMFPHLKAKLLVFASDWRGQFYALNAARKEGDQYQVQLLDPATGESLNIPATFHTFHEVELIEYPNESLQVELFEEWLARKGIAPSAEQCVGYIKPLRLGGVDDTSNQEITDLEVYWSFCTQVQQQIANLPAGTKIDKINFE